MFGKKCMRFLFDFQKWPQKFFLKDSKKIKNLQIILDVLDSVNNI